MKKHLISVAILLLLMLSIPTAAWADMIYPAPEDLIVGTQVDHLLATLDPGGTVWTDVELMPAGLRLETEETDGGVEVYLRGTPEEPGDFEVVIQYNSILSICSLHILPGTEPTPVPALLTVESLPEQLSYTAGDSLDPAGLSLQLTMSDGSVRSVTEGYELYPTLLEKAGTQSIEVSYLGLLCSFQVEVEPAPERIDGIGVLTLPDKVVYELGESLEPAGLSIRVYTNNGTRDVSAEELDCEPVTLSEAGPQQITVHYEEKSCTFTVQVLEPEAPAAMAVYRLPERMDYDVGDSLETQGLVLIVTGSRDSVEYLDEGYTVEPSTLETPGHQEITVRFGDLRCSFHVLVREPLPAPTAAPTPTVTLAPTAVPALPAAPTVAPAPVEVPQRVVPERTESAGRGLLVVLIMAAVLAVGVLVAYVFLQDRRGNKYLAESFRDLFRRRN